MEKHPIPNQNHPANFDVHSYLVCRGSAPSGMPCAALMQSCSFSEELPPERGLLALANSWLQLQCNRLSVP